MEEQKTVKKEMSPDQILIRNLQNMTNRQMSGRLNNLVLGKKLPLRKTPLSNIDSAWAIVLASVLNNTKPLGKMEAYLR